LTVVATLAPISSPNASSSTNASWVLPRLLATFRPIRQPIASSHAMNQPAPPQPRAMNTPSVAHPTVNATSPITRPNSPGARTVVGRCA